MPAHPSASLLLSIVCCLSAALPLRADLVLQSIDKKGEFTSFTRKAPAGAFSLEAQLARLKPFDVRLYEVELK